MQQYSTSASPDALATKSDRACVACAKRKTKCDHEIPCSACKRRGQAHVCTAPVKRKKGTDSNYEADQRRTIALSEIDHFRSTLDSLRARLPNLEHFITQSASRSTAGTPSGMGLGRGMGMGREEEIFGNGQKANGKGKEKEMERKHTLEMGGYENSEVRKRSRGESLVVEGKESSSEDIEASVNLEFMALGRQRTFLDPPIREGSEVGSSTSQSFHRLAILGNPDTPIAPVALYPDWESLAKAAPTNLQDQVIFHQGLDLYGWHHAVIHQPTFHSQLASFQDLDEHRRFELASPAWLALYFALLAVSTKFLGGEEQRRLGWGEEETAFAANRWFDCAVACLYRSNFLQVHDLHALQAIALVVLSGRDAGSTTLIASLLGSGLSIAQDMGLHRLPSDESFAKLLSDKSGPTRARLLIDREIKKRTFWALLHSDWFAIPFRVSWVLSRKQVQTPLPLNVNDLDLTTGEMRNRPNTEFTSVSWLLRYIELGDQMQAGFQHILDYPDDYAGFLTIDTKLEAIMHQCPSKLDRNPESLAPSFEHMRTTYFISAQHKRLSMHRPYLHMPAKGENYEMSRRKVIDAARAILREAPRIGSNRIWTVLYHISAAAFIIMLELFEHMKVESAEMDEMRKEVRDALPALEKLKQVSTIAERGLQLVGPLLATERMREEAAESQRQKRMDRLAPTLVAAPTPQPHITVDDTNANFDLNALLGINSGLTAANTFAPDAFFFDEMGGVASEEWLQAQLSFLDGMNNMGMMQDGMDADSYGGMWGGN